MAKIKLEDGRTINFEGTPTTKDVEEVVAKLGAKPQEQKDGFFKSLVKSPVNTLLVRPAERVGRGIAYGYGAITGNEGIKEAALNADAGVSLPGLGKFSNKTPVSGKQIVGEGLESAAEIAALSAPGSKLLSAPKLGTRMLAGGTLAGTYGAGKTLAEGGTTEEALKSGAIGFAAGAVLPAVLTGAGKATKGISSYASDRFPKLLGIFSGEQDDVIRAALKSPKAADEGLKAGDEALRRVVEKGAVKSTELKNNFIKGHSEAFKEIAGSYGKKLTSKKSLESRFNRVLKGNDIKIGKSGLDFSQSKVQANPGEMTKIQNAYDALKDWDDFTLEGVNKYKQLIGALRKFSDDAGIPSKSPTLGSFYDEVDKEIITHLPKNLGTKYSKLNKNFTDNIDLFDDMVDAFNKGDPFSRMAGVLGKNKDSLRRIVDFYEKKSKEDILGVVAGRELGMEKNAAFGFLNPRSWIDFFISPKVQGKIITKLGSKMNKPSVKSKITSPTKLQMTGRLLKEVQRGDIVDNMKTPLPVGGAVKAVTNIPIGRK